MPDNLAAASWQALQDELDIWQQQGLIASLWWRDDDAIEPSAGLQRLRDLTQRFEIPLALSVIPSRATRSLSSWMRSWNEVAVIQHGLTHGNLAPLGAKKSEWNRKQIGAMLKELTRGQMILSQLFAEQSWPVLVPPWNRIALALVEELPSIGFTAVSAFQTSKPRSDSIHYGCRMIHVHIDPIHWPGREFVGEHSALTTLMAHLQARRLKACRLRDRRLRDRRQQLRTFQSESDNHVDDFDDYSSSDYPSGLLTHHLVTSAQLWHFLEQLLILTCAHPAVRWLGLREISQSSSIHNQ